MNFPFAAQGDFDSAGVSETWFLFALIPAADCQKVRRCQQASLFAVVNDIETFHVEVEANCGWGMP